MTDHPTTATSGDAGAVLDPELSTREVWRALCQLDARERRGETVSAIDAGRLRRHLEDRIRAEAPELAGRLPSPGPAPPRLAWPLLVALAVAQQGSGGFRTGLRIKPPRAGAASPDPVERAASPPPDEARPLPPITVTPLVPQPAARRAAALVRAELERLPPVVAPAVSLRHRLSAAVAEPPPHPPASVPAPPIPASEPTPPPAPPVPGGALLADDTAERLARLERDSAAIEVRAIVEEGIGRLRLSERASTLVSGSLLPLPTAMTRGIVVEVAHAEDDGALGVEAGLVHAEEAEVTIISAGASGVPAFASATGLDEHRAHRTDDAFRLAEEAEVEIVLPGMSPKPRPGDGAASSTVDRFLGALVGRR